MLSGEEWKEKRAEITPAFTASRVRNFFFLVLLELSQIYLKISVKSNVSNNR